MSKRTLQTGIAIAVVLLVVGIFFILGVPFNTKSITSQTQQPGTPVTLATQDTVVGTGPAAKAGDQVTVNYTGKLGDGTVFDSSVGKTPFTFMLGAGQVIPGWDQGLVGMKAGGKRLLVIPPQLAYGSQAYGPIPANSTLTFEVELLKITPSSKVPVAPEGPAAN